MNAFTSISSTIAIIIAFGLILYSGFFSNFSETRVAPQAVEVRDGIQYITIQARGGYSPATVEAQAGIPTKLIVKTDGTYDCSAALVIRSIGYEKILPSTGEEVIDIGVPRAGEPLQALCSMGMYSFTAHFN